MYYLKQIMEELVFNLAYIFIFTLLGIFTLFTHVPKNEEFRNYLKARKVLSGAFFMMASYCMIRIFVKSSYNYTNLWTLLTFSMTFSWMQYSSLMLILNSAKFKLRHIFVDGVVPVTIMLLLGISGYVVEDLQKEIVILLILMYFIKTTFMFFVCVKEYRECERDIDNFYDDILDISWIKKLIWMSLFLSVGMVLAIIFPSVHTVFDIISPIIFTYMSFKFVNFTPTKIERMRKKNESLEIKPEPQPKKRVELPEKIGKKVDEWIDNKSYCRPDLNIKDVASEIGTNQNYLSVYLNNHLNMTFQTWLNTLRIEESKKILLMPEKKSLEAVGIEVGIPESYNFSRWFKNITGMTPFQYRKTYRK